MDHWQEFVRQACKEIQTASSILDYLRKKVVPSIQPFSPSWDLSPIGVEIVRHRICVYLFARLTYIFALATCITNIVFINNPTLVNQFNTLEENTSYCRK